jgi:hypothetical protein
MIDQPYSAAVTFWMTLSNRWSIITIGLLLKMDLKYLELLMNLEKLNRFKPISEKKSICILQIYPMITKKIQANLPSQKTYEELFYVEDPEDELDDIDHLEE